MGDSFTYTLSGDDAENFEIVNGQLKLKDEVSANFEVKDNYLLTITATDSGGETIASTFTLNVVSTIDLSNLSFSENQDGAVIGDLSVTDDSFTTSINYSLSGEHAEFFEIVNGQLKLKDGVSANFEAQNTYNIAITVADDVGTEATINFTLSVTDAADAHTAISISPVSYTHLTLRKIFSV